MFLAVCWIGKLHGRNDEILTNKGGMMFFASKYVQKRAISPPYLPDFSVNFVMNVITGPIAAEIGMACN